MNPLLEALGNISGPLTFVAFFGFALAFIFIRAIRSEFGFELLKSRFGLDQRRYSSLLIFLLVALFVLAVFALVIYAKPKGTELSVFLTFSSIVCVFAFWFAYQLVEVEPEKEISLTGNVYWQENDKEGEPITNALLNVGGINGEWRTSAGGYFRITFSTTTHTKKKYTIRVTVPHPRSGQNIHESYKTSKKSDIVIKVPLPADEKAPLVDDTHCEALREQQRNTSLRIQALETRKSRLGPAFPAMDEAELLRARQDLRQIEQQLDEAGCRRIKRELDALEAGATTGEETSQKKDLVELHERVAKHFSQEELRTLCFKLGVDYDDLPGSGKTNKARELVTYLERRNRIPELVELVKRLRPDAPWDIAVEA